MPSKKNAKAATAVETPAPATTEAKDATTSDMPEGPADGKKHRRGSSVSESVAFKAEELAANKTQITIHKDVPRLNWKMNTSLTTIDEFNLDVPLTNPPLKAVYIWFPSGIKITARNLKHGVTIKDALKAIYKLYHKKADDELDLPVLDTIEWTQFFAEDRENWGAVLVKQKKEQAPVTKKKAKN
ncbi:hypothetical protein BZA05DRAFT_401098 [Tricharina praecox]|uniref:uncharacterized protein n=1 Tax=Tricharina praecox TaxID=43433 RepID=UPI00221F8E9E|nr:uncharacterized protein BZA05DRAFT_401098 [Tricharina praecox]KAI5850152.1 hypothetical protein BZA05DRAFT_401098 [Tricharina praecox]